MYGCNQKPVLKHSCQLWTLRELQFTVITSYGNNKYKIHINIYLPSKNWLLVIMSARAAAGGLGPGEMQTLDICAHMLSDLLASLPYPARWISRLLVYSDHPVRTKKLSVSI